MRSNIEEVASEIQAILEKKLKGLIQGVGHAEDYIIVFVVRKTPEIEKAIPLKYKGFNVKLQETGGDIIPHTKPLH